MIIVEDKDIKDIGLFWKNIESKKHERTCIVILSSFPRDKKIAYSNLKNYKYEWIFIVDREIIKALVFYEKAPIYNFQKTNGHNLSNYSLKRRDFGSNYGKTSKNVTSKRTTDRYPRTIISLDFKEDIFIYLKRTYMKDDKRRG